MSRPAYKPTKADRDSVFRMAACGIPERTIAKVLDISEPTLRKYYREELDKAHVKANTAVATSLYTKAVGNGPQSVTAAIFWLKTRMGWRDVQHHEVGEAGAFDKMTDREMRAELTAQAAKLGIAPPPMIKGHKKPNGTKGMH